MSAHSRARSEGIVVEEVDGELVVYVQSTQTAHALSTDAASVWRCCDGQSSAKDIARRVGLEEARVAQALGELSAAELLEEPEGISRRAFYRRMAELGAAVSAPLIYSVAIPAASAAQSSTCGDLLGESCEQRCLVFGARRFRDHRVGLQWSRGAEISVFCQAALTAVSCPSRSFCIAVDQAGNALTPDNAGGLEALSCTGNAFCTGFGIPGGLVASARPTGGTKRGCALASLMRGSRGCRVLRDICA